MIYKLVFDRDGSQPAAYHLSILCACRAIHEEAVALAYNMHTHVLHIQNYDIDNHRHHGHYEDHASEFRRRSWRIRRQQSSVASQLDLRVSELRPHIAATIAVLQIHEIMVELPYATLAYLFEGLIPDVLTVAERLDAFINLRKFTWTIHSPDLPQRSRWINYYSGDYVKDPSEGCATGILSRIVGVLPHILLKWPLLEELNLHLPKCTIDIPWIMFILTDYIPDDYPGHVRHDPLRNLPPRITLGDDALDDSLQLRLRTNRRMSSSDVVLRIEQDVAEKCQYTRKQTSVGLS